MLTRSVAVLVLFAVLGMALPTTPEARHIARYEHSSTTATRDIDTRQPNGNGGGNGGYNPADDDI